jgi:hypothetical protein
MAGMFLTLTTICCFGAVTPNIIEQFSNNFSAVSSQIFESTDFHFE